MDVGFTFVGSELFDVRDYVLDGEVLASVAIDQDMTLFIVEAKRARANVEDRGLGKSRLGCESSTPRRRFRVLGDVLFGCVVECV